jgi:hypothetical protein
LPKPGLTATATVDEETPQFPLTLMVYIPLKLVWEFTKDGVRSVEVYPLGPSQTIPEFKGHAVDNNKVPP